MRIEEDRRAVKGWQTLRLVLPVVAALLMLTGCSDKYEHRPLTAGAPGHARIGRLLAAVRQAGPAGLEAVVARDAATDLNDDDRRRLLAALTPLAQADRAELLKADRFGSDICRATFSLTRKTDTQRLSLLLKGPDHELRWLKPN